MSCLTQDYYYKVWMLTNYVAHCIKQISVCPLLNFASYTQLIAGRHTDKQTNVRQSGGGRAGQKVGRQVGGILKYFAALAQSPQVTQITVCIDQTLDISERG